LDDANRCFDDYNFILRPSFRSSASGRTRQNEDLVRDLSQLPQSLSLRRKQPPGTFAHPIVAIFDGQIFDFPETPDCATVASGFSPGDSLGRDATMTSPPVGVERRIGQRFAFNLPVCLRDVSTAAEGLGFTQDLSSRGAFLFTDMALSEGAEIELTLRMPSEITLGESMRVCCRGRVLRIVKGADHGWKPPAAIDTSTETKSAETKIGVAVCLKGYEYLPELEDSSADFRRISALHAPVEPERSVTSAPSPRPVAH
jgi:hypothetical protein